MPNKADRIQRRSAVSRQFILLRALGTSPPTKLDRSVDFVSGYIVVAFARLELLKGNEALFPTAGDAFSNHKIPILQFLICVAVCECGHLDKIIHGAHAHLEWQRDQ